MKAVSCVIQYQINKIAVAPYVFSLSLSSAGSLFFFLPADSVYLPDEELLEEYILNENGLLYQGSWDQISSLPWNFGQVANIQHF